jgi:hypothetical protein
MSRKAFLQPETLIDFLSELHTPLHTHLGQHAKISLLWDQHWVSPKRPRKDFEPAHTAQEAVVHRAPCYFPADMGKREWLRGSARPSARSRVGSSRCPGPSALGSGHVGTGRVG